MQFRRPLCSRSSGAVQAAEPAKTQDQQGSRKAVAEPRRKADAGKKQWDTALAEIKKAQAVEKRTPFEDYQIDEFLGYILIQQKKYGEAAPVFERMLNSGLMPPEQVDDRTKAVAQMYFQEKDYKKSAEWAKKWLDKHPNNEDMTVLLGQSYYLLERLQECRRDHVERGDQCRDAPARRRRKTISRSC